MRYLLALMMVVLWPVNGWGANWYVRPVAGEYGAENGTSYAAAFDGWGDIVWGAPGVIGGDTLYVCGTFLGEYVNVGSSGDGEATRIIIDGACPNETSIATITGTAMTHALRMSAVNYATVKNINITSGTSDGIGVLNNSSYPRFENVKVSDCVVGIVATANNFYGTGLDVSGCSSSCMTLTGGANNKVYNSVFHDCGTLGGTNNVDGIFVGNGATNFIIDGVVAYNVEQTGIDVSDDTALDASGVISNSKVYNNGGQGIKTSLDNDINKCVTINNVIAFDNNIGIQSIGAKNCTKIYNSTFGKSKNHGYGYWLVGIDGYGTSTPHILEVQNTISSDVANTYAIVIDSNTTYTGDNNLFYSQSINSAGRVEGTTYSFVNWKTTTGQDESTLFADPLFVNAAGGDFRLKANSPARNAGVYINGPNGITHDALNRPIPKIGE